MLHASLNLEIRLRKLTFTKVKLSCPLFRQRNLSIQQKVRNLEQLIESQLDMKTMAEMSDLESAIRSSITEEITNPDVQQQPESQSEVDSHIESSRDIQQPMPQKMEVGEFAVGMFTDGFYPGEITKIEEEHVTINFLIPHQNNKDNDNKDLWKWPSEHQTDEHKLHMSSILPIRPVLGISKFSTNRIIIYELVNADIIQKFV